VGARYQQSINTVAAPKVPALEKSQTHPTMSPTTLSKDTKKSYEAYQMTHIDTVPSVAPNQLGMTPIVDWTAVSVCSCKESFHGVDQLIGVPASG